MRKIISSLIFLIFIITNDSNYNIGIGNYTMGGALDGGNNNTTVAQDFESSCVSEERPVFTMVAGEGFEPPTFGL